MRHSIRFLAAGATLAMAVTGVSPSHAQTFSDAQRGEIEQIMKNYLLSHPEVLQEVVAELEKKQAVAEQGRSKDVIAQNQEAIFNSPHQVVVGNPRGDVTLVEFFDYNCGYCKRTLGDMAELVKSDGKLRVVLKEFPVLGPGSIEAAQVSVAARMQDKGGKKFFEFHQKLMGGRGQADKAKALAAAKEAGFDMARLEKDSQSPEVKSSLEESMKLAEALGINGTPSFVIGDSLVPGAVGLENLRQKIKEARARS